MSAAVLPFPVLRTDDEKVETMAEAMICLIIHADMQPGRAEIFAHVGISSRDAEMLDKRARLAFMDRLQNLMAQV